MKNNSSDPRTGFNIGYDFAFYRLNKPESLSGEVIDGYYHKYDLGGTTRKADVFIKKWLNLRLHAYERGIHFSEELSVNEIMQKFQESEGFCPIIMEKLTIGKLKDTDWSIDRVINDYGYLPSNIIVMSRRANEAKGSFSLSEVKSIRDSGKRRCGLSQKEWCNLFDMIWRFSEKYKVLNSNFSNDVMGLNNDFNKVEFGLALLNNITDTDSRLGELCLRLFIFECCQLPVKKQKEIQKRVKKLMMKRAHCSTSTAFNTLMERSSSVRRIANSILSDLSFEASHDLYLNTKSGVEASILEAKTVQRVKKNVRFSFSQRSK